MRYPTPSARCWPPTGRFWWTWSSVAKFRHTSSAPKLERSPMSLAGKKIGVLIESDFYEPESWYYQHRFAEEGAETHFLSRMWGQSSITFHGHEWKVPFECTES